MISVMVALMLSAQSPHEYVNVYNFPKADSCATWTRYRANDQSQSLEGWVLGFVSGRNAYGAGNGDLAPGVTAEGVTGWVDQYCAANPLDSVTTAGFKLVKELERRSQSVTPRKSAQ